MLLIIQAKKEPKKTVQFVVFMTTAENSFMIAQFRAVKSWALLLKCWRIFRLFLRQC